MIEAHFASVQDQLDILCIAESGAFPVTGPEDTNITFVRLSDGQEITDGFENYLVYTNIVPPRGIESTLSITNGVKANNGDYQCIVENIQGIAVANTSVNFCKCLSRLPQIIEGMLMQRRSKVEILQSVIFMSQVKQPSGIYAWPRIIV